MMSQHFFVSGIGTNVGKTISTAILCRALKKDYWKPVQAGDLHHSDSIRVKNIIGNDLNVFPEQYRLNAPMSPHAAAEIDHVSISLSDFQLPHSKNGMLVEGAGGLMVPLNRKGDFMVDLAAQLQLPIILVANYYLGSINHTLLSLELLKNRNQYPVLLVLNGTANPESRSLILSRVGSLPVVEIPEFQEEDPEELRRFADQLQIAF